MLACILLPSVSIKALPMVSQSNGIENTTNSTFTSTTPGNCPGVILPGIIKSNSSFTNNPFTVDTNTWNGEDCSVIYKAPATNEHSLYVAWVTVTSDVSARGLTWTVAAYDHAQKNEGNIW